MQAITYNNKTVIIKRDDKKNLTLYSDGIMDLKKLANLINKKLKVEVWKGLIENNFTKEMFFTPSNFNIEYTHKFNGEKVLIKI